MYCRSCGKQLSDEAIMCPECGAPTKPLTPMPAAQESTTVPDGTAEKSNLLGIIGFFLSTLAFVTGIVFGAFMHVYSGASLLVMVISSTSILPALVGISLGIFTVKNAKGAHKAFAITGIILASVALLFLFLTGCIICSGAAF